MDKKRIKAIDRYLRKQAGDEPHLSMPVDPDVNMIVVIPAYCEDQLGRTLESLEQAYKKCRVIAEVIVVLNSGEDDSDDVRRNHRLQYKKLSIQSYSFALHSILLEHVPSKSAGVGHARKTGMDEALRRLSVYHPHDGIIICLDADCIVDHNYLETIRLHFSTGEASQAGHCYFEHILPEEPELRQAIIKYEMHLRLMKLQMKDTGHPQAFHAVGSCMVVRAWAYASQGGMNKRQAGEDFYFIHKFSKIGELQEIEDAIVYPSSRISSRVPFGTGAAVSKHIKGIPQLSYAHQSYDALKSFLKAIPDFYRGDNNGLNYLHGYMRDTALSKIEESIEHSTDMKTFSKRFLSWFDAFRCFKYLHHLRDNLYPDVPVENAMQHYCRLKGIEWAPEPEYQLGILRKLDRPMEN